MSQQFGNIYKHDDLDKGSSGSFDVSNCLTASGDDSMLNVLFIQTE